MISLNYDPYAQTFSNSRKDLKWKEIDYFLDKYIRPKKDFPSILDVGCGNWRLLGLMSESSITYLDYLWVDSSAWLLDEAKKDYPNKNFMLLDMKELDKIDKKFSDIFFIASFHHLWTIEERLEVLKKAYLLLEPGWMIYFTNWSLESSINYMIYRGSKIPDSENEYWSKDFNIKIWEHTRFYHSFNLSELEFLFKEAWFEIIENREFENMKNFVSVIKKT